ncbi:MAG TPA: sigma-70 family RNA polymerase sigma factor [Acidimicrobiales bacterium]|nr:sigma-70 family RNA polymerase sigma factor [Acidimicrobiales bacterium]
MDLLTQLAQRARQGDTRALGRFVEATYQEVSRFCAGLVDEKAADDLCQETFTRAVRALPKFRGDSAARTWLLAIARHACLDELRLRARRRRREAGAAVAPQSAVADPSGAVIVADLLRELEPDRRTAFVLTQVVGLSYQEAAQVCACPLGTIRSRVARARADLVALIDDAAFGEPTRHHA